MRVRPPYPARRILDLAAAAESKAAEDPVVEAQPAEPLVEPEPEKPAEPEPDGQMGLF